MLRRGYSKFLGLIYLVGDLAVLNTAFIFSFILLGKFDYLAQYDNQYTLVMVLYNLVWLINLLVIRLLDIKRHARFETVLWDVVKATAFHALVVLAIIALVREPFISRSHLMVSYLLILMGLILWRLLFFVALKRYRRKGANYRNVIIVGAGTVGEGIFSYFMNDDSHGYKVLGFFDDNKENCQRKSQVLGSLSDINSYIKKVTVDEIYMALPLNETEKIREIMNLADNNLIRVKIIPDFRGFLNKRVNIDFYDYVPVLSLRPEPLENLFNRFIKRLFDICFSLLVILLVFPWLMPLMAVLIKSSSPGPIFFAQKRSGRGNNIFRCFKFRTMRVNKNADTAQATRTDPRVTRLGRFMRKTNLDELPQFFNVLMGDMSVVGPRPHMLRHTEDYSKIIDRFMVRHLVKPGITGLAQVYGYRGPTEDTTQMYKRVRYDVWYLEHWSLLLDIKIIVMTVMKVFEGDKNAV